MFYCSFYSRLFRQYGNVAVENVSFIDALFVFLTVQEIGST